ncbi:MAG: SMC-Scp complex subunit ScpB [Synergistes sp.]|nr:SMC-Scp complex subunit ScpB [Synergistes sp.]
MQPTEENKNTIGQIERQIEALLFVSPQPVSTASLAAHLSISEERVESAVSVIKDKFDKESGLTLLKLAGGWQMATAPDLTDTVDSFASFLSMQRIRLSRAALETLAVIAYNQPVTMAEIEEIRSVRCDRVVETLLKNGLIDRPHRDNKKKSMRRYRTTNKFLEVFGLSAISALPTLEELREYDSYEEDAPDEENTKDEEYAEEMNNDERRDDTA